MLWGYRTRWERAAAFTLGGSVSLAVGLGSIGVVGAEAGASARRVALPDAVPSWIIYVVDRGPAKAGVIVRFRLYLAGRSPAQELRLAKLVSTPGTERFRSYLGPAQFATRFGPAREQVKAVEAWAQGQGLSVIGTTAHYVALSGAAPTVSKALATSIHAFGGAGSAPTSYAPVRAISVPVSIGGDVVTAVGLDNDSYTASAVRALPRRIPVPAAGTYQCSSWWGQHRARIPAAYGRGSAATAVCGYTPAQLRSAYGIGTFTGKGATIAIVLDGQLPTMRADADRFFAAHHLRGLGNGQYSENIGPGFAASCGGAADLPEEPLDVETAHIIAPDAKLVYVAVNCSSSTSGRELNFLDAETRIVDRHLADVETDSFSTLESEYTPAMAAAWTQILEQGAVEGIGFNFDSGDGGDNTNNSPGTPAAVTFPASDPWATAVGGTTLEIGRAGQVIHELGWGDTIAQETRTGTGYLQKPPGIFAEGSTGGRSELFHEPSYQRGVVPRALSGRSGSGRTTRIVPDVAADASPITGWLIGYTPPGGGYEQILEGGTSGASPIIAALEADAKQAGGRAVGFANPTLYALRGTAAIRDIVALRPPFLAVAPSSQCYNGGPGTGRCLVTLGLDSSLRAAPGFDDVTGVGAATSKFIAVLAAGVGSGG